MHGIFHVLQAELAGHAFQLRGQARSLRPSLGDLQEVLQTGHLQAVGVDGPAEPHQGYPLLNRLEIKEGQVGRNRADIFLSLFIV